MGDRYVLEEMVKIGANLGGEQSGHLLFLDQSATGDGIVSALQLLAVMRETGQPLSALLGYRFERGLRDRGLLLGRRNLLGCPRKRDRCHEASFSRI